MRPAISLMQIVSAPMASSSFSLLNIIVEVVYFSTHPGLGHGVADKLPENAFRSF
jgi:hypothetical protein